MSGSVTYQFQHLAIFSFKGLSEEDAVMALLDADCDPKDTYTEKDEETGEEVVTIVADFSEYTKVRNALVAAKADLDFIVDKVTWETQNMVDFANDKEKEQFERLLGMLEEDEDVQDVYYNVNWEPQED